MKPIFSFDLRNFNTICADTVWGLSLLIDLKLKMLKNKMNI